MSSKILHFCDKCKKEVEGKTLTRVSLELDPYSSYKTTRFEKVYQHFEVCEECAAKLGFLVKVVGSVKSEDNKSETIEPTTKDKLYDVIVQMIQENGGV
jgi:hypothetical protein